MSTTALTAPTGIDESDLLELLGAYQHLQAQNLRMSTHLSSGLGLSGTDLRVLLFLFRNTDVSPKDLADLLEHTTGSITALVDRLERSGHLQRRPHPTDRRKQTIHLTEVGLRAVHHVRDSYQDAFEGIYTGPAMRAAADVLRTLGNALERTPDDNHGPRQPHNNA